MKKPQAAPQLTTMEPDLAILKDDKSIALAKEYNERYLHWDVLQYHDCGSYGRENLWYLMKLLREGSSTVIDIGGLSLRFNLPDRLQQSLHRIDMSFSAGFAPMSGMDDRRKMTLSLSSMMEESIASSQMEGAVTTAKEAKRMLRDGRDPRNLSERMILNNYNAMEFIRSNLDRELTPDFIRELHGIITEDTLEIKDYEGTFRNDNSIAVRDVITGETYHEPVSYEQISSMISGLCTFANSDKDYVHPIVKGILIHYVLAYVHPFMDGNGRVSRSLFYWYTMKHGYSSMEYVSLSKAIKDHKGRYEAAYQLCETDGNDVTYFIDYNLSMLMLSVEILTGYLDRKREERQEIRDLMYAEDLTQRQTEILGSLKRSDSPMTVYELSSELGVSPQTIRNDIYKLIQRGCVKESSKSGHRQRFCFSDEGQRKHPR